IDRDRALSEAKLLEAEAASGNLRGPLHGVPVALKDVFDAEGMPTIANSRTTTAEPILRDSIVAARFWAAGAIILGKATTVEFAGMGIPPETRNPWNLAHTPGGSSSGSGAVVGARMVPAAIGTQTGGSNLRPAAYNGVCGFKGSYGRIGRTGCIAVSYSLDHPGIIARDVDDLALIFSVLAGYDPGDPATLDSPVPPAVPVALGRAPRLGIVRDFFFEKSDSEMCAAVDACANQYAAAGATIAEVKLPTFFDLHAAAHKVVMASESVIVHSRRHATKLDLMTPRHRNSFEVNSLVPATFYLQAQRIRRAMVAELAALFTGVDALIMPTAPGPAPEGLDSTGDASLLSPWSFVGFPAASIPAGLASNGLPMGLQIVGRPLGDGAVLAVAQWCQEVTGLLPAPPMFS
ncbi:MAG: amidase, partial [Dehalococcoidia bacterium]